MGEKDFIYVCTECMSFIHHIDVEETECMYCGSSPLVKYLRIGESGEDES